MSSEYKLISEKELPNIRGKQIHVQGWNIGAVFHYVATTNGVHELRTPKTGRVYHTTNNLIYTKKNSQ